MVVTSFLSLVARLILLEKIALDLFIEAYRGLNPDIPDIRTFIVKFVLGSLLADRDSFVL